MSHPKFAIDTPRIRHPSTNLSSDPVLCTRCACQVAARNEVSATEGEGAPQVAHSVYTHDGCCLATVDLRLDAGGLGSFACQFSQSVIHFRQSIVFFTRHVPTCW